MVRRGESTVADKKDLGFASRAVHAGERAPHPDFTPVSTPIYQTVTYTYDDMEVADQVFEGTRPGYVYSRYANPTVIALEEALTSLEGGRGAEAYASGMAAVFGALLCTGLGMGDRVLASRDLYGATYSLLDTLMPTLGVETSFVDFMDLGEVERAMERLSPRLVIFEVMSNPLLRVTDVEALVELAKSAGASVLADSSFTTPYLIRPLEFGVDLVIHSTTKFLAGHSDVMGGVVVTNREEDVTIMEGHSKQVGGILGPFDAWLALRGIKTLPLRMQKQCENAEKVAGWLSTRAEVRAVHYPGLKDHPQHAVAKRLFDGRYGGMVSFELSPGEKQSVHRFMESLRLCQTGTTLGDIYTQILNPAMSSHRALTDEQRADVGISTGLMRMSVGIEDAEDIMDDLEGALRKL
jgi:cystathionine gamma-synthase/methionine-gamma-lyase